MATIRIRAAEGRLVRDPKTMRPIPDDGIDVADTDVFWYRRIAAGDVVICDPPVPATPAAPAARKRD